MDKVTIAIWFDEQGFNEAFPKRLALRSGADFNQVVEDTVREFIHVGEPKDWPDLITD